MVVFGPVPSRRLGYSLGINHIPPKHCSYACVYCQVGRTTRLEIVRRGFFPTDLILGEVRQKVDEAARSGRTIDFLTLVPDGEPCLDKNLGLLITELKQFDIPLAVISNASLIDRKDVREELALADWVSLKIDAVQEDTWRKINRPYRRLSLHPILAGILAFRGEFGGTLVTETMLVSGLNDDAAAIQSLMDYLLHLQPDRSYLSIPNRPPVEGWVRPPQGSKLKNILDTISTKISFIDVLFESEVSDFVSTGCLTEDVLGITAVHPIREEALRKMVFLAGENWSVIEDLITFGKLVRIDYRGEVFYTNSQGR